MGVCRLEHGGESEEIGILRWGLGKDGDRIAGIGTWMVYFVDSFSKSSLF